MLKKVLRTRGVTLVKFCPDRAKYEAFERKLDDVTTRIGARETADAAKESNSRYDASRDSFGGISKVMERMADVVESLRDGQGNYTKLLDHMSKHQNVRTLRATHACLVQETLSLPPSCVSLLYPPCNSLHVVSANVSYPLFAKVQLETVSTHTSTIRGLASQVNELQCIRGVHSNCV